MTDYTRALEVAVAAAREAGDLLRRDLHRPDGPRGERGHAEADTEAEHLIRARLLEAFPFAYLGEETGSAAGGPSADGHRWIVDPNDGTQSYTAGRRGSAVSIATLRDGVPVLGVVFAFAAPDDAGDLFAWAEGCGPIVRNGKPVENNLATDSLARGAIVVVSQHADRDAPANLACVAPGRFWAMPSIAYRLALVAVGEGVAAVSLNGPVGWDYAAGHALVRAAGGVLLDQRGREVTYGFDGRSGVGGACFGGGPTVAAALADRPWHSISMANPRKRLPFVEPVRGWLVEDPGMLARAQGCLLGQVAGDSLGSLVEFESARAIAARYPDGVRDLADGGPWHTIAGQPTDDSELALALARSIVVEGHYDPGAAVEAYASWYQSGPFDCGTTTRSALAAAAGAGPDRHERLRAAEARANRTSQANGSLMRVSPLGIVAAGSSLDEIAGWARADSALTHPHTVCREACAAFAIAIAHAVVHGDGPQAAYGAARDWTRRSSRDDSVARALDAAEDAAPADFQTQQGWVLVALQNAFFRLLHAPTFEEGVVATVMAGGDTDTNAAIAGALLGAVHGRDAVPARWRAAVVTCRASRDYAASNPRPETYWPVDALDLAERLLVLSRSSSSWRQTVSNQL
jgi:ADP-ribosylglycohydrolase/fructose-1,6-bisphosphatase/inositol monophosphatase family enzyme